MSLGYDEGTRTIPIAEAAANSLRAGGALNRLSVVAQGPRLRVLVNDEPVLDVEDSRHLWGMVSLGAVAPWAAKRQPPSRTSWYGGSDGAR